MFYTLVHGLLWYRMVDISKSPRWYIHSFMDAAKYEFCCRAISVEGRLCDMVRDRIREGKFLVCPRTSVCNSYICVYMADADAGASIALVYVALLDICVVAEHVVRSCLTRKQLASELWRVYKHASCPYNIQVCILQIGRVCFDFRCPLSLSPPCPPPPPPPPSSLSETDY